MAICLSRRGASDDRNPQRLDLPVDLRDAQSIAQAAAAMAGRRIDVLIHNAALRGNVDGLPGLEAADLLEVMQVNLVAPLVLTRALLPVLAPEATVAFISSRAGSCAEGSDPDGDYAYCLSKAALNRAVVKLRDDYGLRFLAIHPGWVRTDMGGPAAPVPVEAAAEAIFTRLTAAPLPPSGWFGEADGTPIRW